MDELESDTETLIEPVQYRKKRISRDSLKSLPQFYRALAEEAEKRDLLVIE